MNKFHFLAAGLALSACALPGAFAAKATSDIISPPKRQPTVDLAEALTKRPPPARMAADMASPFNPPDFDKPDSSEQKNAQPRKPGDPVAPKADTLVVKAPGDRETLETLASRIPSTGTIVLGGKPLLIVGKNRLEVGQTLVVTYDNQDYELELVAIDRTTFTLRYRAEETTRPIRSK
jgi:hypothetical protein